MTDHQNRTRDASAERLRSLQPGGVTPGGPAGGDGDKPAAGGPVGRRRFFGLVAGAVVAAGAVYALMPGHSGLPEPPGQLVGPEFRAATLALKPAPQVAMPAMVPTSAKSAGQVGWASCAGSAAGTNLSDLDLVVAIDTTGSMGGVIEDVKSNVARLIANLQAGQGNVRVGIVAYRDTGDEYVVRQFPFTSLDQTGALALTGFVSGLRAAGGGDWPEKMDAALDTAVGMTWRGDVPASIVIIADAPAHGADQNATLGLAQALTSKIPGSQVSLIDTGSGGNGFMRALPKSGGGQYITYDGHILNSLFPAITGCPSR